MLLLKNILLKMFVLEEISVDKRRQQKQREVKITKDYKAKRSFKYAKSGSKVIRSGFREQLDKLHDQFT